jgi:hypothetical protein
MECRIVALLLVGTGLSVEEEEQDDGVLGLVELDIV